MSEDGSSREKPGGDSGETDARLRSLSHLIGRDCTYLGRPCRIVELLADERCLVVETREPIPPIQTDQYGQALCRGNEVLQIPIFDEDSEGWSEDLKDLLSSLQAGS